MAQEKGTTGERIKRLNLSIPRYGMNSVTVPTKMFYGDNCSLHYEIPSSGGPTEGLSTLLIHLTSILLTTVIIDQQQCII